jgi:hypothetical protein
MPKDQLAELTQPQRDRLAFIELRVRFVGEIRRQDLVARFGIQSAAATRDLALYKELSPGNIDYDPKGKAYVLGPDFRPIFDFPPERVLSWLTQGFGDGEPMRLKAWVASESPSRLTHPDLDVLASVTRAIHQGCPLALSTTQYLAAVLSGNRPLCADRQRPALACPRLRPEVSGVPGFRHHPDQEPCRAQGAASCSPRDERSRHSVDADRRTGVGAAPGSAPAGDHRNGLRHARRRAADEAARCHGWIHPAQMECRLLA